MNSIYEIKLSGCDGDTNIVVYLNDEHAELIKNLSELSKEKSTSPCEPIMTIKKGNF